MEAQVSARADLISRYEIPNNGEIVWAIPYGDNFTSFNARTLQTKLEDTAKRFNQPGRVPQFDEIYCATAIHRHLDIPLKVDFDGNRGMVYLYCNGRPIRVIYVPDPGSLEFGSANDFGADGCIVVSLNDYGRQYRIWGIVSKARFIKESELATVDGNRVMQLSFSKLAPFDGFQEFLRRKEN
jgi:hypothetical protein